MHAMELTILMPCLNEARTVGVCIRKAFAFLHQHGIHGEVLIADNGSTDGSQHIARDLGARVLNVPTRGYGAALIAGIGAAQGRYVIMGDSDDSYDFSHLGAFVRELWRGTQLVMGNRFKGGIRPGAMPALHRWLGNPVLSTVGRVLFKSQVRDFHCGLRGFDREAIQSLGLCCTGMEFASEMVVKASLQGLSMSEVPTTLSPDGRDRPPHLRSWRDGWRHLRFLLLFSPSWLFLYPGLALLWLGGLGQAVLLQGPLAVGGVMLDVHTMLYAGGASVMGLQLVALAMFAKVFAADHGFLPATQAVRAFARWFSMERGLICGALMMLMGLVLSGLSLVAWDHSGFGHLDPRVGMRIVIPAMTLLLAGMQVLSSSLFMGVLGLREHARVRAPRPSNTPLAEAVPALEVGYGRAVSLESQ
ncbi:MAG: glycosyltransferase family 2 protein [Rhizobacter sp.]